MAGEREWVLARVEVVRWIVGARWPPKRPYVRLRRPTWQDGERIYDSRRRNADAHLAWLLAHDPFIDRSQCMLWLIEGRERGDTFTAGSWQQTVQVQKEKPRSSSCEQVARRGNHKVPDDLAPLCQSSIHLAVPPEIPSMESYSSDRHDLLSTAWPVLVPHAPPFDTQLQS